MFINGPKIGHLDRVWSGRSFSIRSDSTISALAISASSIRLAVGDAEGVVYILDVGGSHNKLPEPKLVRIRRVNSLVWCSDTHLAAAYSDACVILFDLIKGRSESYSFDEPIIDVQGVGESYFLILTSLRVFKWHITDKTPIELFFINQHASFMICPATVGLIGVGGGGQLTLYGDESYSAPIHTVACKSAALNSRDNQLMILSSEGIVSVTDLSPNELQWHVLPKPEWVLRKIYWSQYCDYFVGVTEASNHVSISALPPSRAHANMLKNLSNCERAAQTCNGVAALRTSHAGSRQIVAWLSEGDEQILVIRRDRAMSESKILHISDLHLVSEEEAAASCLRLEQSLDRDGFDIDYIVISGDVSDKCSPEGYIAAVSFIKQLAKHVGIGDADIAKRILVIPGNHDVDMTESSKAFNYFGKDTKAPHDPWEVKCAEHGVIQARQPDYDQLRLKRFNDLLYLPLFGVAYPSAAADQLAIVNNGKDDLMLLGLNSAFRVDHVDPQKARVNISALRTGIQKFERFRKEHPECVAIVVVHHPIGDTAAAIPKDNMALAASSGVIAILHGDAHEPDIRAKQPQLSGLPTILGAGFCGTSKKQLPQGALWAYHYVIVDWERKRAFAISRTQRSELGDWVRDGRYGTASDPDDHIDIASWK